MPKTASGPSAYTEPNGSLSAPQLWAKPNGGVLLRSWSSSSRSSGSSSPQSLQIAIIASASAECMWPPGAAALSEDFSSGACQSSSRSIATLQVASSNYSLMILAGLCSFSECCVLRTPRARVLGHLALISDDKCIAPKRLSRF